MPSRPPRHDPADWYSFKPIWPPTEAESADLERRGLEMMAGRPDPGPRRELAAESAGAARAVADA